MHGGFRGGAGGEAMTEPLILKRDIVRETDHEKARYAWNYRRCRLIDCGALFAAMVAR
jgi:hypothetical protein